MTPESDRSTRVRLYGRPHSSEAYELRDFLQRSVVAFDWVEIETDQEAQRSLGVSEIGTVRLPVVELPDGHHLFAPSLHELADRLG